MLLPYLLQIGLVQNSIRGIKKRFVCHLSQLLSKPALQWDRKTLLLAIQDFVVEKWLHGLFQNVFAVMSAQLQRRRNGRYLLHELVIQKWSAHFERHGHAGAI